MSKWVYTDDRGCIMGVNNNNMTGNTGWQQADAVALTVNDILTDDHGAALYKLEGGEAVERTQEEREADWPDDPEDRVDMNSVMYALLGVNQNA